MAFIWQQHPEVPREGIGMANAPSTAPDLPWRGFLLTAADRLLFSPHFDALLDSLLRLPDSILAGWRANSGVDPNSDTVLGEMYRMGPRNCGPEHSRRAWPAVPAGLTAAGLNSDWSTHD